MAGRPAMKGPRRGNLRHMNVPDDLLYSTDHEWVRSEGGNRVRVGITDYAQDALGDVVFIELPEVGRSVGSSESFGEVESTKSVSDVFAPLAGTVVEVNTALDEAPETMNEDPYGDGWICVIELAEGTTTDELMSAAAYVELTEGT